MAKFIALEKLNLFKQKIMELIPTKTSDLQNDSNYVSDASYVHTDANFTQKEKTKLAGIAAMPTIIRFQQHQQMCLAV